MITINVMTKQLRHTLAKRKYLVLHPDKRKASVTKYYTINRQDVIDAANSYTKAHPELKRKCVVKWNELHPEKIRQYGRTGARKRRAVLRGLTDHFTNAQWLDIKSLYNNSCLCCGRNEEQLLVQGLLLTPDHVVPLAVGGHNTINNIQPLCHGRYAGSKGGCNQRKRMKHIDYRPEGQTI